MGRAGRLRVKCVVVAFLLAACGEQEGDMRAVARTPEEAAELDAAGRNVVRFLQGRAPFDSVDLADSVTLYVSPEGGGESSVYKREELRSPSNWKVVSGGRSIPLVPPPGSTTLTTKTGRHFNCMEYDLASRDPELARLPHVGAKLEPENAGSCLQTWNLTLVFDSKDQPRLVAAVYDQWEW